MTRVTEFDVCEGQVLAGVEVGDVSVLVAAPEHVSAAELDAALADVPDSVAQYLDRRVAADGGEGQ